MPAFFRQLLGLERAAFRFRANVQARWRMSQKIVP